MLYRLEVAGEEMMVKYKRYNKYRSNVLYVVLIPVFLALAVSSIYCTSI